MATLRIENKENSGPEITKGIVMAAQTKRVGLSQRNTTNVQVKVKQPLGNSSGNCMNIALNKNVDKITDEVDCGKENRKNIVNPIVPVAQFEAFKVYEDINYEEPVQTERIGQAEQKLKHVNKIKPSGVSAQNLKTTDNVRIYSKKEVMEIEKRIQEENTENESPEKEEVFLVSSPMSIEKSCGKNLSLVEETASRTNKSAKDIFFEMEEYREDIYKYLREHELHHRPKPGYMKKQPDVTSNMRTILVDWLVEVGEEYKLHTETLYLAVNYIDRFLSYMSVVRGKLQLVGTAAMFLASKYEEIYPPHISEFVYITDDTYNMRQVIRMEHLILKVLSFDLSIPTPLSFITAMCVINNIPEKIKFLAMYLSELALLNGDICLEFLPSVIAASAIAVARHTLIGEAWNSRLASATGYELNDLKGSIEFLSHMFKAAPTMQQHAIQDKYKSQKYKFISQTKPNAVPIDFK